ncbi:MAG: hypothetical protein ABIO51_03190 [Solirubrobacteraceae bacterium]
MTGSTEDAIRRFAAADPGRDAAPTEADREATLRAIVAEPEPVGRGRRRLRGPLLAGAGLAIVATSAVALTIGLPDPPPPGVEGVGENTPGQARQEALTAARLVPLAPGEPDPGIGRLPQDVVYTDGAAAGQVIARRQCTWQRQLLLAYAAGDGARAAEMREQLAEPVWYRYFEASSAEYQRHLNLSGDVALLREGYEVNCGGVTRPLP